MANVETQKPKPRDTCGRRSRFVRTPTAKRIMLGDRDREILRWLYRYRYLGQSHLLALIKPRSEKRFIERLGDLYHETGLINRPAADPGSFDARAMPMLYEITSRGIEWLASLDALPHRAVTFSLLSRRAFSPQLPHTMMIIEALLDIEMTAMAADDQRFVPVDEILARAPEGTCQSTNPLAIPAALIKKDARAHVRKERNIWLIPDALYGIEYFIDGEKLYRFWALECERTSPAWRSTGKASSTALKKKAYEALISSRAYRSHWGIPNLKLSVVRSPFPSVFG